MKTLNVFLLTLLIVGAGCNDMPENKSQQPEELAETINYVDLPVCIEKRKENPLSGFVFQRDSIYNFSGDRMDDFNAMMKMKQVQIEDQDYAAILMPYKWHKKILRVSFIGGSLKQKMRVMQTAKKWEDISNVRFDFGEYRDSDISISFHRGEGSWSYIGNISKEYYPSMNFGWLKDDSSQIEYDRVVLHEFGHALGMIHEHQHPDAGIPWNREAVYQYYRERGWEDEDIEHNIFGKYDRTIINYTDFDIKSIMLYAIPNSLTEGDYSTEWNTSISTLDSLLINQVY